MKNLIKVKDHPHLYRDEDTGAIINCDDVSYNRYMNKVKRKNSEKEELDNMKKDIEEIKSLLKEFLNR
jgi:hypothetical protein|tara:strand:+ start:507 stop:710 length:204 start_codon:yes stop_codon:yes gene_type:complete